MKEITGNLITLAKQGKFDVITHGCNCFCQMGAGIAPQMANAFGCDNYPLEQPQYKGDINKLGNIEYKPFNIIENKPIKIGKLIVDIPDFGGKELMVINSYTQYNYGKNHKDGKNLPVDYNAIIMCMKKINYIFSGKTIGLPKIGAGLAGGDWDYIKSILYDNLYNMNVIIVNYDNSISKI